MPGNNVSVGKRYATKISKGNQWLRSTLIQAAHAGVKVKDSCLAAFYHRLVARRGVKQAIVAVAHKILTLARPCCGSANPTWSVVLQPLMRGAKIRWYTGCSGGLSN